MKFAQQYPSSSALAKVSVEKIQPLGYKHGYLTSSRKKTFDQDMKNEGFKTKLNEVCTFDKMCVILQVKLFFSPGCI